MQNGLFAERVYYVGIKKKGGGGGEQTKPQTTPPQKNEQKLIMHIFAEFSAKKLIKW